MYKNDRIIRRYSESFKLQLLSELSKGKYTKREMSRIYDVPPSSINDWINKYERKDLMNKRVMIETAGETTRLKVLQDELDLLKKLLIKKDLEQLANDSYLEVAAKNLGYNSVEELKKNLNIKA